MTKVLGVILFAALGGFVFYEVVALIRNIVAIVKERKSKKSVSTASEPSEAQDKSNKEV